MKLLFVSDTHLGFDLPFRPRIQRRRRGPDFFRNFEIALDSAHRNEVDAVVHGGDILFRSKVPARLVQMAFEPLIRVADAGTPVYVVPGNHERSAIPYRMLAAHPNIHIFDTAKTYLLERNGMSLALAGFPYVRRDIRGAFPQVLEQTRWRDAQADVSVLCMHHCVEGATLQVGTRLFRFTTNHDVIKLNDIPGDFSAVLSGHIHRFQVLTRDLRGKPINPFVFYPGSVERTSYQEKDEEKGYLTMEFGQNETGGTGLTGWKFHPLPARPMRLIDLKANGMPPDRFKQSLESIIANLPIDAVAKIRIHGQLSPESLKLVSAASLRTLAPETMNIEATPVDYRR